MVTADALDYSYPVIQVEKALRALHEAMLEKDYNTAHEAVYRAIVELRLVNAAIRDEKERHEALHG